MPQTALASTFLKLLAISACISASYGGDMGPLCSQLKTVEIHHRRYFDIYLYYSRGSYSGIFYDMIVQALQQCCPTAMIKFIPLNQPEKSVEEILVDTVKMDKRAPEDGVLKLFFPEFADKTATDVYDGSTSFIRLSRSPGHAVIMIKPEPKERVFVGEIVVKSWAILIFLVTFAWLIGIVAWMSDHHVNPVQFPNPFYVGMFEGFWWSVVTMTTVGYGDKAPKGILARSLAVFWIMVSTVFLALFTANATAILSISQAEEDHTFTIGKKIGVLNSKHFVEVELNTGASIVEFYTTFEWVMSASQDSGVDRLLFPNYMDFLLFVKDEKYKGMFKETFVLTNAIQHPFQIGMAFAADNENMSAIEEQFLMCMRRELPISERQAREKFDWSKIEFTENTKTKELKTALDSDNLLMISYYFFGIIVILVSVGLVRDFWVHWRKTRSGRESTAQVDDPEITEDAHVGFDDVIDAPGAVHDSRSGDLAQNHYPGESLMSVGYRMSIRESYGTPPTHHE